MKEAKRRLKRYWKPDGRTADLEHDRRMRQWLRDNGIDSGPIPLFLSSDQFQNECQRMADELEA